MAHNMKTLNSGGRIEGLPSDAVLRSKEAPKAVPAALDSWQEARVRMTEAARTLEAARRAVREESILPAGREHAPQREAEEVAGTRSEAEAHRVAARESTRAANALVDLVAEHSDALARVAARITLRAHVEEVDLLVQADEVSRTKVGPRVPRHPLVPSWEGTKYGNTERTPLETLDVVNTHALAEIAGDRFGMVEVRDARGSGRILTTPARARMLVERGGHGSTGWTLTDDTKETEK